MKNKIKGAVAQLKEGSGKLARAVGVSAAIAAAKAQALVCRGAIAFATEGEDGGASDKVKDIIDAVMVIFPWIGGFFILSGGVKLFLAYRNDQPEAQAGAAKDIVIGIAFVAFDTLLGSTITGLF